MSGQVLLTLKGHDGLVTSAAFSPDGASIVTASSDGTARVWDAMSEQVLLTLKGHDDFVTSAAFSPDGARVVTASSDETGWLWDVKSGQPLLSLEGHGGSVTSAAFSRDGAYIVTASSDATARVWDAKWLAKIRREELVRRACQEKLVPGSKVFTPEEAADPILSGLAGTNPCERRGPLSLRYWKQLIGWNYTDPKMN